MNKSPGYSDEVMDETHDVIHNAELEEQKMHGKDALCADDVEPAGTSTQQQQTGKQESTMDKVKDKLGLNK